MIDDRDDLMKAETEKQIIGSMASAMLYSSLIKAARQPTLH
ncbi:Phage protein [Burkholderia singularis]|uniref:Phage protein n=1 Tax=Burkholderia singularis TaxID=1503053 RepID=A0A238H7P2_9BURK|nr:Phage protein [Burkholderia singularis]